ncbi:MAG: hypothetical protein QGG84_05030 [Rhodospirillales bacterium]|nr:hypothetical protein [Rhodospirillales bacterium]
MTAIDLNNGWISRMGTDLGREILKYPAFINRVTEIRSHMGNPSETKLGLAAGDVTSPVVDEQSA